MSYLRTDKHRELSRINSIGNKNMLGKKLSIETKIKIGNAHMDGKHTIKRKYYEKKNIVYHNRIDTRNDMDS